MDWASRRPDDEASPGRRRVRRILVAVQWAGYVVALLALADATLGSWAHCRWLIGIDTDMGVAWLVATTVVMILAACVDRVRAMGYLLRHAAIVAILLVLVTQVPAPIDSDDLATTSTISTLYALSEEIERMRAADRSLPRDLTLASLVPSARGRYGLRAPESARDAWGHPLALRVSGTDACLVSYGWGGEPEEDLVALCDPAQPQRDSRCASSDIVIVNNALVRAPRGAVRPLHF